MTFKIEQLKNLIIQQKQLTYSRLINSILIKYVKLKLSHILLFSRSSLSKFNYYHMIFTYFILIPTMHASDVKWFLVNNLGFVLPIYFHHLIIGLNMQIGI
jgi:hypothetical protein